MQDLMPALRRACGGPPAARSKSIIFDPAQVDFEEQLGLVDVEAVNFMKEPLIAVDALKEQLSRVAMNLESMADLRRTMASATSPEAERLCSEELARLMHSTNELVLAIKQGLDDLQRRNAEFEQEQPNGAEAKMRENLHAAVRRKFRTILRAFQAVQLEYKESVNERVRRQVRIVFPGATEDELAEISTNPEVAASVIQARLSGQTHEALSNALGGIQDKYNDIRRLEQGVLELHQLFVDMATLIDYQGDLLDQIEFSVNNAKDYTEKAELELIKSRRRQLRARKRMCCIVSCIIVVAVVAVLPVIVQLTR